MKKSFPTTARTEVVEISVSIRVASRSSAQFTCCPNDRIAETVRPGRLNDSRMTPSRPPIDPMASLPEKPSDSPKNRRLPDARRSRDSIPPTIGIQENPSKTPTATEPLIPYT